MNRFFVFFHRSLDIDISHCWTVECKNSKYIKTECTLHTIDTDVYDNITECVPGVKFNCVYIKVERDYTKPTFIPGPLTCVSLIKKQLGIRDFFVFTPKQLYKKLLKIGGKDICDGVYF